MIVEITAGRRTEPADLPERPPISDPEATGPRAAAEEVDGPGAGQPRHGAVGLSAGGQAIAGGFHLAGMFDTLPAPGQVPTYTATLPLGGAAFVAMLEITLVGEGWPLRRLPGLSAGLVAVVAAWIVALIIYF